ncbi:MAG: hypothetical protein ACR2J6_08980 [Thermoleophilaceae bacterium]
MAARDETTGYGRESGDGLGGGIGNRARSLSTETKQFFKTSEFVTYVIVFIGILIAAKQIEGDGGNDYFTADKAWLYITILTLGYMLSRGIAKSGSREPYSSGGDDH